MPNYIDQNLLPDEKILYRTKKHYIIFFQPFVWTIASLCILLYPTAYLHLIAGLFAVVALFSWANAALIYWVSEYAITTNRVLMREGFFAKQVNETRIATIANVNVLQGPLGQILDFGTVVIKTFGGDDAPFMEIPKPLAFKKQLEIQLNQMQTKSG